MQRKIAHDKVPRGAHARDLFQSSSLQEYLKQYQSKDDEEKVKELIAFKARYEKEWHLTPEGELKGDTRWEVFTGKTQMEALIKRLIVELKAARSIEKECKAIKNGKMRETKLLEYARIDFLKVRAMSLPTYVCTVPVRFRPRVALAPPHQPHHSLASAPST